jgi:hypothetical protein
MIDRLGSVTLLGLCLVGLAAGALAQGSPVPTRRAGWWEQTFNMQGQTMTMYVCTDAAYETRNNLLMGPGRGSALTTCSSHSMTPIPGGWKVASTCGDQTTRGTIVGDLSTHFRADFTATGGRTGEQHVVMDETWKGACPVGVRPGQAQMPGGMIMGGPPR